MLHGPYAGKNELLTTPAPTKAHREAQMSAPVGTSIQNKSTNNGSFKHVVNRYWRGSQCVDPSHN